MIPTLSRVATTTRRTLRCEGHGPLKRGCFNWVGLGKLTEIEFRETLGVVVCLACYVHGWFNRPPETKPQRRSKQ